MHPESYMFCQSIVEKTRTPTFDDDMNFVYTAEIEHALDLGGANVNGTARNLWPSTKWTVVDSEDGDDVTLITDAAEWTPDREYPLVICTEVLEHTPKWRSVIHTAVAALQQDGHLIITCAGPNREPHSTTGLTVRDGEYYSNILPNHMMQCLWEETHHGLLVRTFTYDPDVGDIYFYGVRGWTTNPNQIQP